MQIPHIPKNFNKKVVNLIFQLAFRMFQGHFPTRIYFLYAPKILSDSNLLAFHTKVKAASQEKHRFQGRQGLLL